MRQNNNSLQYNLQRNNNTLQDNHGVRNHTSEYAMSIVDPFNHRAEIPDGNMTASILKSVSQTHNVTVPNASTGDMMLVWIPGEPHNYLTLYFRVGSRYYFNRVLPMDQDLGESFTWGRLVSAALGVKSSTTSGTTFNISGTINACLFEELPNLSQLTYNTITSYCRDGVSVMANGTVTDGVISLYAPTGDQEYRIFEDLHNFKTQNRTELPMPQQFWASGPKPEVGPWLVGSTLFAGDVLPPNCYGQTYLFGRINCRWPTGPDLVTEVGVKIVISYETVLDDWVTLDTIEKTYEFRQSVYVEGPNVRYLTLPFRTPTVGGFGPSITQIDVFVENEQNSLIVAGCDLTLVTDTYYNELAHGPGTIMGIQGLTPNQIISISGHYNYEVVPNAKLSQNVQTYGPQLRYYNPVEMPLVQTYLSNPSSGFKFIWNPIEYSMFIRDLPKKDVVDLAEIAKASGFTDFMSTLWQYAKPILRYGAPLVGGALAGPAGATLGTAFSTFLGDSAMHRPGSVYRGATALLDDTVMERVRKEIIYPNIVKNTTNHMERKSMDFEKFQRDSIIKLTRSEFDANMVINSFPLAYPDGRADVAYIIRTNRPVDFDETLPLLFNLHLPNETSCTFSIQGPGRDASEFTDFFNLLIYYHMRGGQPGCAYTLWTPSAFDGGSCGGAILATAVLGTTLPLPITGMFFKDEPYCPNLIGQKAQLGDILVIGDRFDPTEGHPFASTPEQMVAMSLSVVYSVNARTIDNAIHANRITHSPAAMTPESQSIKPNRDLIVEDLVEILTENGIEEGIIEFETVDGYNMIDIEELIDYWSNIHDDYPDVVAKNSKTVAVMLNRINNLAELVNANAVPQIVKILKSAYTTMRNFKNMKAVRKIEQPKLDWPEKFPLKLPNDKVLWYDFDEIIDMLNEINSYDNVFKTMQRQSYQVIAEKANLFKDLYNGPQTQVAIPQLERASKSLLQLINGVNVAHNSKKQRLANARANTMKSLEQSKRRGPTENKPPQVPQSYLKAARREPKVGGNTKVRTTDTSSTSEKLEKTRSARSLPPLPNYQDETDYDALYEGFDTGYNQS